MRYKASIPFILGILSVLAFWSPEILGSLLNKGITLSLSKFIVWAAIMLGSAAGGLVYGFYLAGKKLSFVFRAVVLIGTFSCLAIAAVEVSMVLFLLTGGG